MSTVCFTGHRPNKLGGYSPNPLQSRIRERLSAHIEKLIGEGVTTFISGMALGVDQWAAEIVLSLKTTHPHIRLIAAIPFVGQESAWAPSSIRHYNHLIDLCDERVVVSPGGYSAHKMQLRNQWMVDNSTAVIAVWDGSSGGTGNCVSYARKLHKTIYRLNPLSLVD